VREYVPASLVAILPARYALPDAKPMTRTELPLAPDPDNPPEVAPPPLRPESVRSTLLLRRRVPRGRRGGANPGRGRGLAHLFSRTFPPEPIVDGSWGDRVSGRKDGRTPHAYAAIDFPSHLPDSVRLLRRRPPCLLQVAAGRARPPNGRTSRRRAGCFPMRIVTVSPGTAAGRTNRTPTTSGGVPRLHQVRPCGPRG